VNYFGRIFEGEMYLSEIGKIVAQEWQKNRRAKKTYHIERLGDNAESCS
jgi:hypothetical protein